MSVKTTLMRFIGVLLILVVPTATNAQQIPNLSTRAKTIKRTADTLTTHSPISVVPFHEAERYGEFSSSNQEGFTFYDVDRKTEITLKYDEVRNLKKGYGGYNSVAGRHTDRTRNIVVTVIVLVVLGALIGAVAAAKN